VVLALFGKREAGASMPYMLLVPCVPTYMYR
jgi:hypothetical protein